MSTLPHFDSEAPLAVSQVSAVAWKTIALLIFHGSTRTVEVPIGSLTDWASIPRLVAWLIAKMVGAAAAVVHDHCWRVLCRAGLMTYQEADRLLLEMLTALDREAARIGAYRDRIPAPTRWLMWAAVRWTSILTQPRGWVGAHRDLPRMLAITALGLPLVAPAALLLPSMGVLAVANRISARRGIDHPTQRDHQENP